MLRIGLGLRCRLAILGLAAAQLGGIACGGRPAPPAPTVLTLGSAPVAQDAAPAPAPAPPADAAPLDHDLPRLAERSVALFEELGQAFADAAGDCSVAAAKLGELRQRYADVVAANAKLVRDGRVAELRAALAPHAARLDAAARATTGSATLARCASDRTFANAFDQLVGAPP